MHAARTITVRPEVTVVVEDAGDNLSAYVPSIPGCVTTGHSLDEIARNMDEALTGHLGVLYDDAIAEDDFEAGDEPVAMDRKASAGLVISIRLSSDAANRLEDIAEARDLTLTQIAKEALNTYMRAATVSPSTP
jgi:predicted RNase H-like HicB family nuclease